MKRPSTASLITLGLLVCLIILVIIPNLVPARWAGHQYLVFNVQVLDSQKKSIPGAQVTLSRAYVGPRSGRTDSAGQVRLEKAFIAYGGGWWWNPAGCSMDSTMRVEADGYKPWEASLSSLFGAVYDYANNGTTLSHTVTLTKAE